MFLRRKFGFVYVVLAFLDIFGLVVRQLWGFRVKWLNYNHFASSQVLAATPVKRLRLTVRVAKQSFKNKICQFFILIILWLTAVVLQAISSKFSAQMNEVVGNSWSFLVCRDGGDKRYLQLMKIQICRCFSKPVVYFCSNWKSKTFFVLHANKTFWH